MRKAAALWAGLAWASGTGALAQPADPVGAARQALHAALADARMTVPVALFVKARAPGYGIYEPHDGDRFRPGEPLNFYAEPVAFKYRPSGAEWTFGVTVDFAVLGRDGATLGGREKFLELSFRSHHRNTELMLNGTVSVQNAPPGDYQLLLTIHDQSSADVAEARLPFTVE